MHIIIGFLAALLVFSLIRYGINSSPKQRRKLGYIIAICLAGSVLLLLLLTGRIHFLAALAAAVIPFVKKLPLLMRYIPLFRYLKQQAQASMKGGSGSRSSVTTSLLTMMLDNDTGDMEGEVLLGDYKGKRLTNLSLQQLFELYQLATDQYPDSIAVFDAFLQRRIGTEWRKQAEKLGYQFEELKASFNSAEMDVPQALQVLGLEEGATKDDILNAHRKLMQKLHPDRGGSNFLAAQVNRAKDVLLEKLNA